MKKLFIVALMVALTGTAAVAAPPITTKVLNHFGVAFAGASNVQWKATDSFVKASFTRDNQQWEAFYDLEGNLYGTSRNVTASDVPAKGMQYIAKKYACYTPKEYIEFTHETEGKVYYVSLVNEKTKLVMQVAIDGNTNVFKRIQL